MEFMETRGGGGGSSKFMNWMLDVFLVKPLARKRRTFKVIDPSVLQLCSFPWNDGDGHLDKDFFSIRGRPPGGVIPYYVL